MENDMSIGGSGRIVLEVDPAMKRRLYAVLAGNGLTLKAWFTHEATAYIQHSSQGQLFNAARPNPESDQSAEPKASDASA